MKTSLRNTQLGIWGLALGYFLFYVPYSALTKALSKGLLPGTTGPISGFELLPAVVIATLITFIGLISLMGWWKYLRFYDVMGLKIPFASNKWTFFSGIAAAFIIITTTLAYSFTGISIVFAALLMRGGVLIMSPFIDTFFNRKVHWYSWVALALSMTALLIIFGEKGGYVLSVAAAINIFAYLSGYFFRLQFMTRIAKSEEREVNYRFFVEEMLVAGLAIVLLPALVALSGIGAMGASFRIGFTDFMLSNALIPALGIGALYACLYIFGSRIYLDHRENTYCIPFNRCASLLAGVAAASLLSLIFGGSFVSPAQLLSAGILLTALIALSYPAWQARKIKSILQQQHFVFVCPSNTGRSPMARAICQAEIKSQLQKRNIDTDYIKVISAGIRAEEGKAMNPNAQLALENLGIPVLPHQASNLHIDQVKKADKICCMTVEHANIIKQQFPDYAHKVLCLDPVNGVPNPHGRGVDAYQQCANYLQQLIRSHLQGELQVFAK
ncbi:MAG: hypothetical protein AAFP19_25100 [Bacteroidota bacterium]